MKLKIANDGAELDVSDESFGAAYNETLVHQIVTNDMLNGEVIRLDGAIRLAPK